MAVFRTQEWAHRRRKGQLSLNGCSFAGLRANRECSTQALHPLPDSKESEPAWRGHAKTASIIPDHYLHFAIPTRHADFDRTGTGMAAHVRERLLHYPEDTHFVLLRKLTGKGVSDRDAHACRAGDLICLPVQGCHETEIVEHGGPQEQCHIAHHGDRIFDEAADTIHPAAQGSWRVGQGDREPM